MKQKYVIEPRFEDGSLNVKMIGRLPDPIQRISLEATENQIADAYFQLSGAKESASMQEIRDWYKKEYGCIIRPKTW